MDKPIWRVGVINDLHIPYHDRIAVAMSLRIFKDAGVDEIILNGDVLDFYTLNFYSSKHPDVKEALTTEIDAGIDFLVSLRKMFPDQKITFLFGNHEHRLDRWVVKNCPHFWNMLKLDKMLRLEELKIGWLPYQTPYSITDSLKLMHSPPSYGVNGARTSLLKKMDTSYIYACTHRVQHSCQTTDSGKVIHAWFNGWLGDTGKFPTEENKQNKTVFDYMKGHDSWQKVCLLADVFDDGLFSVHQIHLNGYKATWGSKYYDFTK